MDMVMVNLIISYISENYHICRLLLLVGHVSAVHNCIYILLPGRHVITSGLIIIELTARSATLRPISFALIVCCFFCRIFHAAGKLAAGCSARLPSGHVSCLTHVRTAPDGLACRPVVRRLISLQVVRSFRSRRSVTT